MQVPDFNGGVRNRVLVGLEVVRSFVFNFPVWSRNALGPYLLSRLAGWLASLQMDTGMQIIN